jgi:putative SOS response-associated peptidase YedK
MCGRFTRTRPVSRIAPLFDSLFDGEDEPPRYNIAPTQRIAAVREETDGRRLRMLRWGLVPRWAKSLAEGNKHINARAETITERPSYRDAYQKRRCLIAADGFLEWRQQGKDKLPHYFRLKGNEVFGFAGLWERWKEIESCTIITTEANELVRPLHERMPVILHPKDYGRWLDPKEAAGDLRSLLVSYPADLMESFAVDRLVNSVRCDSPECLQPPARPNSLFDETA